MLYHLYPFLAELHGVFNVFFYISFRTAAAVVTSLLIAFAFGPPVIRRLRLAKVGQVVREVGPESHLAKTGTPTMGGVLILGAPTRTTDANRALAALGSRVRADNTARALFTELDADRLAERIDRAPELADVRAALDAFLDEYGHRETTSVLLLSSPTWSEAPNTTLRLP